MRHSYRITGMTCEACEDKVKDLLQKVPGVSIVTVDLRKGEADITMEKHVETTSLQAALKDYPKYRLSENEYISRLINEDKPKTWLETYKPVLLIFGYITGVTLLVQPGKGYFNLIEWMNQFMAGFFLVFSFFKLLDIKGFADSYSTYDIIARYWRGYGYIYPFIELLLGAAYLTGFSSFITNGATFIIMGISIIGVLQNILNKKKIKCACLGTVFDLPMTTITIIEDALMIGMSAFMLITMI